MNLGASPPPGESTEPTQRGSLAFPYALAIIAGAVPLFFDPQRAWFLPIIAMMIYLGFGLQKARREGLTLEFSDSFYYLGFTLTISSLLASLEPFTGIPPATPDILRYFGLGLLTTLIGVVGRTVLQMFYRSPSETIEITSKRIETVAAEYLAHLEMLNTRTKEILSNAFTLFEAELRNHLAEVIKAVNEVSTNLKRAASRLAQFTLDPSVVQQALSGMGQAIEAGTASFRHHVNNLERVQADFIRAQEAAAQTSGSLQDSIRTMSQGLKVHVTTMFDQLEQLSVRIRNTSVDTTVVQRALNDFASSTATLTSDLDSTSAAILHVLTGTIAVLDDLNARAASLRFASVEEAVARLAEGLTNSHHILTAEVEHLRTDGLNALKATLSDIASQVAAVTSVLDDIINAIHVRLEDLS